MGIRIKHIVAENLGPLGKLSFDPGNLNLVYGSNESGKSFLTEFIIRCLFKNKKQWGYLRESGNGKIIVEGLGSKPVDFRPSRGIRLENFFEEDPRGLPLSLLNLLVVKEGDTSISDYEEGITRDAIKELLSSRRILDALGKKISQASKSADIEPDLCINDRRGASDFFKKQEDLRILKNTILRLNEESVQWMLKDLSLNLEKLRAEKELLLNARRFKASCLSRKMEEINRQLISIPEMMITNLSELISSHEQSNLRYLTLRKEMETLMGKVDTIPDLEKKKELLLKAKYHHAFLLSEQIRLLREELNTCPEEELNRIEQEISKYFDRKTDLESRLKQAGEALENSKHYDWLVAARENYLKFLSADETNKKPAANMIILSALIFSAGLAFIFFDYKYPGIIFTVSGATIAILYYLKSLKYTSLLKQNLELEEIKSEFRQRFGSELTNITLLETLINNQSKYHNQLDILNDDITRFGIELESLKESIESRFKKLAGIIPEEKEWNTCMSKLRQKRRSMLDESARLEKQLAALETDETLYEKNDPGVKYDKDALETIKSELERLKEIEKQRKIKSEEVYELERALREMSKKITGLFLELTGEEVAESQWKQKYAGITQKREELNRQAEHLKGELSGMGVPETDYTDKDPGIEFSQPELDRTEKDIQVISEELAKANEKHTGLKTEILKLTGADASSGWNDLIDKLYMKKEETEREFEEIKAKYSAEKLLYDTIIEFQQEEDIKLIEVLNSEEVSSVLKSITGRYSRMALGDNGILIEDDSSQFLLKDLSTGAMEQVMIALRIGFLKHLLRSDTAFLILDDAFQHSDYLKRELLVKTVCELSLTGWQIFYLTMDDHIRNLFRKYKAADYKEINLMP